MINDGIAGSIGVLQAFALAEYVIDHDSDAIAGKVSCELLRTQLAAGAVSRRADDRRKGTRPFGNVEVGGAGSRRCLFFFPGTPPPRT
jgi:hypothetical protein